MPTLTADNGQRSAPIGISWLSGLEATNGYVEYTTATLVEAKAGIAAWTDWPVGATAGTAYSLANMVVRLVGTSNGATCVITDPRELIRADSFSLPQVETDPLLWALPTGQLYRAGNVLAGTLSASSSLGAVSLAFIATDDDGIQDDVTGVQTPGIAFDLPYGYGDDRDAAVGDVLRVQLDGSDLGTRTLDADDIAGPFVDFTAASPGPGTYDMRARIERGGDVGPWSNELEFTITAASAFGITVAGNAFDNTDRFDFYTFTSVDAGAAHEDRVLAFCFLVRGDTYLSSVLINGSIPAKLAVSSRNASTVAEIWYAKVPAGSTVDIRADIGAGGVSRCAVVVHRILTPNDLPENEAFINGNDSGAGKSLAVTIPSGGSGIAVFVKQTGGTSTTWTNATETYDAVIESFSGFSTAIVSASATIQATPSANPTYSSLAFAAWSPRT